MDRPDRTVPRDGLILSPSEVADLRRLLDGNAERVRGIDPDAAAALASASTALQRRAIDQGVMVVLDFGQS